MNDIYSFILSLFSQTWYIVPNWIKVIFAVILLVIILSICIYPFREGLRNLYYILKIKIFIKKEQKRIENLINWRKNSKRNKLNYESKKVIVKNVFDREEENAFLEATKKGYVAVIRKKLIQNKSENLLNFVAQWVILDYLGPIRTFLSPHLTTALINHEIFSKLREMHEFEGENRFISSMVKTKGIENLMNQIGELKMEGIFNEIYLPYLRNLKNFSNAPPKKVQEEAKKLLGWLNDYQKRLTTCSKFKYFPVTSFVYVKIPSKDESAHIKRAKQKFEKGKCKIVILSGWIEQKESLKLVSRSLISRYRYFGEKIFYGRRLSPTTQEYRKRINQIHAKNSIVYSEIFKTSV